MNDDLVKQLWESDKASALTNQAARRIEELEEIKRLLAMDKINLRGELAGVQGKLSKSEALLEKAMGALMAMRDTCMSHDEDSTEAFLQAETALKELGGHDDG